MCFTLNVFTVVFDREFMKALFAGIVLDADGAIAVVLDDGFVYVSGGHLDFSCVQQGELCGYERVVTLYERLRYRE